MKNIREEIENMQKSNKKILLFLATEKGYRVLLGLLGKGRKENIAAIVSFHDIGMQIDYYDMIKDVCLKEDIVFYEWKAISNNLVSLILKAGITSCIAISWRYLIPLEINTYLEDDLIVFHDSLLPKYRGFAPLVTAMINGEKQVGASALFATDKADCGEIILQRSFQIDESFRIQEAINLMSDTYSEMALELVSQIEEGRLTSYPQNEAEATYSIWRGEDDYWINLEGSAEEIFRFVNALGYPYKWAKTRIGDDIIRIVECSIENDIIIAIRTPGKIWELINGKPTVVCGSGMIKIMKAVDEQGKAYKFLKLRKKFGGIADNTGSIELSFHKRRVAS